MDGTRTKRVLAIPDLHLPWAKQSYLEHIYSIVGGFDVIVQLGDMLDMYSFSKFARTHDLCTPKEEIAAGFEMSQAFWRNIQQQNPKARKIQLKGNHEARLMKRAFERFPEAASIIARAEHSFYSFPNVETVDDTRSEFEVEGVVYTHGYLTKLGDHAKYLLRPVVHGHTHRLGSIFYSLGGKTIWELDCGLGADQSQVPLQYGPTKTTLWTLGYGVVDPLGPRAIPFLEKPKIPLLRPIISS